MSYAMGASFGAKSFRDTRFRVDPETRDSGFLAPRRPGMTVEIIGAREPMTVCHLVCHGCFPSSLLSPSFRDTRFRVDPETRDSGFLSSRRPGMTVEIIGAREPMTVCHLVCHGCFPSSLLSPSFRDTRFRVDPKTRDSGFLASRRPGMTVEIIGAADSARAVVRRAPTRTLSPFRARRGRRSGGR